MTATPLQRYGRTVTNVFDLLGHSENDMTAALAYLLSRSPALLAALVVDLLPGHAIHEPALRLETAGEDGRTDLEIDLDDALIIIEAKRGWLVPGEAQLGKYAPRILERGKGVLVSLSAASDAYAQLTLPGSVGPAEQPIPVRHLPWARVQEHIAATRQQARSSERTWLEEGSTYLKGAVRVRDVQDSWVFCVVINNDHPSGGGDRTFRQYVDSNTYLHPFGRAHWPVRPPNFMAFRWDGKVQRVQRVIHAEVVPALPERFPSIAPTDESSSPHAIYQLGPQLPGLPVANGRIYPSALVWVLLDQLLTCSTLAEARARSAEMDRR